jgi:glucose-6-phosphate 1-dehydrogenase
MGASGDLAKKKTYPALFELWKAKLLPTHTTIHGFARTKYDDKNTVGLRSALRPELRKVVAAKRKRRMAAAKEDMVDVDGFLSLCFYDNGSSYADSLAVLSILRTRPFQNVLVYLATPPHVFLDATLAVKEALEQLKRRQPSGFVRVVLEKPFGRDYGSCHHLLQSLKRQGWDEKDLFRIDHYLGKEMVLNILTLRRENAWLNNIFNNQLVQSVHLVWKESISTSGRGGYFDSYGIIRDVFQNHLIQLLTLVAMDLPVALDDDVIRDSKVEILKCIAPVPFKDTLVGQYKGYNDDPTINQEDSITPTYAAVRCWVDNTTWKGVPFVLEAGKSMDVSICEIRFRLRGNARHSMVIRIQPKPTLYFTASVKTPGYSGVLTKATIGLIDYGLDSGPDAYSRLLLDVLCGQQASFVRDDELLEAWKIFTPLLHHMERHDVRPLAYGQGSDGPSTRTEFMSAMLGPHSVSILAAL